MSATAHAIVVRHALLLLVVVLGAGLWVLPCWALVTSRQPQAQVSIQKALHVSHPASCTFATAGTFATAVAVAVRVLWRPLAPLALPGDCLRNPLPQPALPHD